jgi:DNA helicase-2/ATP-dependent DNA helicase PcrA
MLSTHKLLINLNEAQTAAVTTDAQHSLVLAGAGSGKTRVLVYRIAWLLAAEGISPYAILAVTFTNKAAAEMRNRVAELLETPARGMWIGTFHSIALRLLTMHHKEAGLPKNFQILDSEDQYRLIRRVISDLELDEKQWQPRMVQGFINGKKNEGIRASEIDDFGDDNSSTLINIYQHYDDHCNRGGLVDFAEMLLCTHQLLLNNPPLLEHYQGRFGAILVDEFQDTNDIQSAFIRLLAGTKNKIMVVGDDDQSIYAWRGAKIDHIIGFKDLFPNTIQYKLEQNYRSTNNILQAANAVIKNNAKRLGKELWSEQGGGELIQYYGAYSEYDEAAFVAEEIDNIIDSGIDGDQIAILYRSNMQSRLLEENLLKHNVAYKVYGGLRFFERMEIKDVLAYVRLINNRHDDVGFERVINTPTRGLGNKTVNQIRNCALVNQVSLFSACQILLKNSILTARAAGSLAGFINMIDEFDHNHDKEQLNPLFDDVIERTGLREHYQKEPPEKAITRLENLDELLNAAETFVKPQEDDQIGMTALSSFLAQVSLEAGERASDKDVPCVQLMTLHSAKGLEFPYVFLVGLEQGLFPHQNSMEDPEKLQEERRLCYVGITRAEQKLFMTYATSRRIRGRTQGCAPSKFLREVPEKLVNQIQGNVFTTPRGSMFANQEASLYAQFQPGVLVSHKIFGEGTIIELSGQGDYTQIMVEFSDHGTKILAAKFAKLDVI